jgi:hypothetical protein
LQSLVQKSRAVPAARGDEAILDAAIPVETRGPL